MEGLQPGVTGTFTMKVERQHCTSRGGPWVFATPEMVRFSERSSHELVAPLLGPGRHTVGAVVNIRHLAPTLEGQTVRAEVALAEVDRRRLKFRIELFDEIDKMMSTFYFLDKASFKLLQFILLCHFGLNIQCYT